MQPKARMTIRFDPPQPPKSPQPPQASAQSQKSPNPQQPTPFSRESLQDDPAVLERIIRQTGQPSVSIEPQETIEFSHPVQNLPEGQALIPGDDLDLQERVVRFGQSPGRSIRSKDDGPSWWKVFISAVGAIATGALFGYLVLTLFTGNLPSSASVSDGNSAPSVAQMADTALEPSATAAAGQEPNSAAAGNAAEEWPAETRYWLQYGVFRSEEAMDAAIQELRDAGLPGFGDRSTDGYRVYAGAATSKAEAEQLSGQMPGHEIFIKSIPLEDVAPKAGEDIEPLRLFDQVSHELADKLSGLSIAALQDKLPEPLDSDKLADLRETYNKWRSSAAAVDHLKASGQSEVQTMVQALNSAMSSIDQYERKVSRYHLWSIQSDLMEMLLADRSLRAAVTASAT